MRLALAQINSTVGDLAGNTRKILDWIERARAAGAELVAFPELAVTGYPPEDLLLKPDFLCANRACLDEIARACSGIVAVVGFVEVAEAAYNAAAVLAGAEVVAITRKERLPNYGVFDEERYFRTGGPGPLFGLNGARFGVNICEDIWYPTGPAASQAAAGAELIVNVNSSPYHRGKWAERERMLATRATDNSLLVAYVNMVGGQDELVFDGASVVFDERGRLVGRAKSFEEDLLLVDLDLPTIALDGIPPAVSQQERGCRIESPLGNAEEVYRALVLGTGDYLRKNGFERALVGLSGGIDSSLVAAVAVDALGPERVTGVS